jgi:hypothetical protein
MTSPIGGSGRRGVESVTGRISGSRSELDAGARAFFEVSKRLKEVGGTGKGSLRNEMHKAVKQAAKPLPKAVQDAAKEKFPQRGGLAAVMGRRKPSVVTRTGVSTAGVRIQDRKTDPRMNAQGRIYHPVFGRPGSDAVQIEPGVRGYFDEALQGKAPEIRDEITDVLVNFAQRIVRGG